MSVNELDVLQTSTSTNDSESVIQFNEFNYTNSFHSIQLLEDLKSLREYDGIDISCCKINISNTFLFLVMKFYAILN